MDRFITTGKRYINLLRQIQKEPMNITQCAKFTGHTKTHMTNVFKHFYKIGLVNYDTEGNQKPIKLTKKGEEILTCFAEMDRIMNDEKKLTNFAKKQQKEQKVTA